jgi:UDP-galactopyranose mutase
LRFEFLHQDAEKFQEVAQINFPNEHSYTRITEFKHMTGQKGLGTTIAKEYPQRHVPGKNVPYYPIPKAEHREVYNRYLKEAVKLNGTVIFAGRLADYKYYNMDQAVGRALNLFEKDILKP